MATSGQQKRQAGPEPVKIELLCPDFILQGAIVSMYVPLESTWFKILNSESLNFKIAEGSGLYICSNEEEGNNHRSELHETVRDYLMKFKFRQNMYSVKLCAAADIEIIDISSDTELEATDEINCVSRIKMEENQHSEVESVDAGNAEANFDGVDADTYNRDDDLRSLVRRRLQTFDNGFLLRVKKEIADVKNKNLWQRNVAHDPLGSYFLSELFDD